MSSQGSAAAPDKAAIDKLHSKASKSGRHVRTNNLPSSLYRGVQAVFERAHPRLERPWKSRFGTKHLGYYRTERAAARAHDAALVEALEAGKVNTRSSPNLGDTRNSQTLVIPSAMELAKRFNFPPVGNNGPDVDCDDDEGGEDAWARAVFKFGDSGLTVCANPDARGLGLAMAGGVHYSTLMGMLPAMAPIINGTERIASTGEGPRTGSQATITNTGEGLLGHDLNAWTLLWQLFHGHDYQGAAILLTSMARQTDPPPRRADLFRCAVEVLRQPYAAGQTGSSLRSARTALIQMYRETIDAVESGPDAATLVHELALAFLDQV